MRRFGPVLLMGVMLAGVLPGVALAGPVGNEGCTPRHWRTHQDDWPKAGITHPQETDTIRSRQTVSQFFYTDPAIPQADHTLRRALRYEKGPGVNGARRSLLRAAVAAVLNAADDRMGYPLHRTAFLPQVRDALASRDRGAMLALKRELGGYNRLGCPLS
jgi:hypothetical protein